MKYLPVLLVLASCATPPERIMPSAYSGPCTVSDARRLAVLTEAQSANARGDAIGVLLIGIPMGRGPDHSAEIAQLKGRCR